MTRLLGVFLELPRPSQVGLVLSVFVIFLLLSFGVDSCSTHMADKRFQKRIAKEMEAREQERKRGDDWEQKARSLELDKGKLEAALELAGKQAAQAMEKVSNAENQFTEDVRQIDATVDPCEHYNRIRAKLNLPAKPCESAP